MLRLKLNILDSDESLHLRKTSKNILMQDSSSIAHFTDLVDISCINDIILNELGHGACLDRELFQLFNHLIDNSFEGFLFSFFHSRLSKFSGRHPIVTFFELLIFPYSVSNVNVVHEFHFLFLRCFKNWSSTLSFVSGGKKVFALIYWWWIESLKILFELGKNLFNVIILLIQPDLVTGLCVNKKLLLFFHRINYKGCKIKLTFDKSRLDTDKHRIFTYFLINTEKW